jgi:hypothetical protein
MLDQENLTMPPSTVELDGFFEHVRYTNPFDVNRVGESSLAEADAEAVHHAAYAELLDLARKAHAQHLGIGALLWGEAGIGKSHLLARLARWAGPEQRQAVFVYLSNMQAAPEQLPRSVLRRTVSILTRGRTSRFWETPLFRLVNATVRHALNDDTGTWPGAEAAYNQLLDGLCEEAPGKAGFVDRPTYAVLFHFFRSAYRACYEGHDDGQAALAVRWLSGDPLDSDEARSLGLPPAPHRDATVAVADDEQIKNLLVALAQIAQFRRAPLILCFDQVDSLEEEQCGALARFQHALLDRACNFLVITCGLRDTLDRWLQNGVIMESSWHRLKQHEILLQRVSVAEARQIVQARLQNFQAPFMTVEPVRALVQQDLLFPLGEPWAEEFLVGKIDVRPRDVINWAREGWRRQQDALKLLGGKDWLQQWGQEHLPEPTSPPPPEMIQELIDQKVAFKVQELKRQRQLEPQTLPPDADNLAGLLHASLQRCLNFPRFGSLLAVERLQRPKYGQRLPHDLMLRHRPGKGDCPLEDRGTGPYSGPGGEGTEFRSGVLCLVVRNRTSMTAYLRRLAQDTQPPQRLVLVTEERCPLDPGAAGKEYLEQVRQRHGAGFQHVHLTFDEYAELDALQAVVGLARSGDLEIALPGGQARRVNEQEVIDSHHRQQRYPAHPLLYILLTGECSPGEPPGLTRRLAAADGFGPGKGDRNSKIPGPASVSGADSQDLRQFIMARLAITMGASSQELAVKYEEYLKHKKLPFDPGTCRAQLEEAARQLHTEGKLNATPHDDGLFLLLK